MKKIILSFALLFSGLILSNQSVAQQIPYEGDTCFALLGQGEKSRVMQEIIGYMKQDSKFTKGGKSGSEWYAAPSFGLQVVKPIEEENYNTFRYYSGITDDMNQYKGKLPLGLSFNMSKKELSKTVKKHKHFKRIMIEKKLSESYEIYYRGGKYTLTLRYKPSNDKLLECISIYRKKKQ